MISSLRMILHWPQCRARITQTSAQPSPSLDPHYRKPLVLQALMGYSTDEIASHLGLTRSAVLSRLHRARQKLRVALGTTDVADGTSVVRTIKATPQRCAA